MLVWTGVIEMAAVRNGHWFLLINYTWSVRNKRETEVVPESGTGLPFTEVVRATDKASLRGKNNLFWACERWNSCPRARREMRVVSFLHSLVLSWEVKLRDTNVGITKVQMLFTDAHSNQLSRDGTKTPGDSRTTLWSPSRLK